MIKEQNTDSTRPKSATGQEAPTLDSLQDRSNKLRADDEAFYVEAFTDPTTREPYDVPAKLKKVATRLSRSYGIRGICDPMYIANVIAFELGLGDGQGNFTEAQ